MDTQLSPRLQRFWFNTLPGRFMNLRGVAVDGNVWELPEAINTILEILPKAGISESELQPFYQDINNLKVECYAVRVGKSMHFYNSMLEVNTTINRYEEILRILDYLNPLIEIKPDQIINVRYEPEAPAEMSYVAVELQQKLLNEKSELFVGFKISLESLLSSLKIYSLKMDMDNFFFDLRLRTRKLELGIENAEKYANYLEIDISAEINQIRLNAYNTMGLSMDSYN